MQINKEELMIEYQQYIDKLPNGLQEIVKNIEDENYSMIANQIALFSEGLEWLYASKQYLLTENINTKFSLDTINEHLGTLVEAMEKKDYIMMSDIIQYELIPYFEELKTLN